MTHQPRVVWPLSDRPVMVVGMAPGRGRPGSHREAWAVGANPSSDLLNEALGGRTDVVLTNVVDRYVPSGGRVTATVRDRGLLRLLMEMWFYHPRHVVCVGKFAAEAVDGCLHFSSVPGFPFRVSAIDHPAFIVRFGRDRQAWVLEFQRLIDMEE